MATNVPVFILGMPRCRTAWLSVALCSLGVNCSHEGMRDFGSFHDYAADLDARLTRRPAGDSDPSLVHWVDQIIERWPNARFLVVYREDSDALAALLRASPGFESTVRAGWNGYLSAFHRACDLLRALGDQFRQTPAACLTNPQVLLSAMEHLTGQRPELMWSRRIQRLNVTTTIDPANCATYIPEVVPVELPPQTGLQIDGLSAAVYRHEDFEMVSAWWAAHGQGVLPQSALPPLGVVVSHQGEPWAAIWCYEFYGVPVAELTFPVTRPGLLVPDAARALLYGALACMTTAGKAHQPEAVFRTFKVVAPNAMVRFLKQIGFHEALTKRTPMISNF